MSAEAHDEQPPVGDDRAADETQRAHASASHRSELRTTVAMIAVATLSALVYVWLTPDGPNRGVLPALLAIPLTYSIAMGLLATPSFAARLRRGIGGLVIVSTTLAWVTVWVALDGGATSPLNAMYLLPLCLAIANAPRATAIICGMVAGGHLLGSAIAGPLLSSASIVWVAQFTLAGLATSWVANARIDQRRQLRTLAEELERLATHDPLTRVLNRRGFAASVDDLLRGVETGAPTAVLVADLDHFKHVNDQHGHAVGDEVLVEAARAINGAVRHGDLVARTGGEEFAIVLLDADQQVAETVAERVRDAVASCHPSIQVSASIGIAMAADDHLDISQVHLTADQAMYRAKDAGRDRVEIDALTHVATSPAGSRG